MSFRLPLWDGTMSLDGFDLVRFGEIRGWLRSFATLNTAFEQTDG